MLLSNLENNIIFRIAGMLFTILFTEFLWGDFAEKSENILVEPDLGNASEGNKET